MKWYLTLNTIFLVFFLGIGIFSFVAAPIALLILMLVNIFYAIKYPLSDFIVSADWVYLPSCLGQIAYFGVYAGLAYICYKLAFASFESAFIPLVFYGIVLIKASELAGDWMYYECENYRIDTSVHKKTRVYRKLLKVSGVLFIIYSVISLLNYDVLYNIFSSIDSKYSLTLAQNIEFLSDFNFGSAVQKLGIIPSGVLAIAAVLYVLRTIHIYTKNK